MNMKKLTFNKFCFEDCDGLYDPFFSQNEQCTGYKNLRLMVEHDITPASLEEIERWEKNPNGYELLSEPHLKYLRFLHPNLRPFIIENWNKIKKLEL